MCPVLSNFGLDAFPICLHPDYHDRTSDGHEDFAYAANVFQDVREAIPFFNKLLVWLREVKLDNDVEIEKGEIVNPISLIVRRVNGLYKTKEYLDKVAWHLDIAGRVKQKKQRLDQY